jgi:hypothetical protein
LTTPWRYIGSGASLRGHGDPLPAASTDLAAVYLIGRDGAPGASASLPAFNCSSGAEALVRDRPPGRS